MQCILSTPPPRSKSHSSPFSFKIHPRFVFVFLYVSFCEDKDALVHIFSHNLAPNSC